MASQRKLHYAWVVLIMGTFIVFAALGLARFAYSLVLPAMQDALGMDNTGAGALATANLAGYLALSLIGGALASRFGPRLVTAIGLAVAAFGMVFTGASQFLASAMIWRAMTGFGSGASNVPIMGLISSWFGPRKRGLASGVAVAGSSIALIATGPLVPRILAANPTDGWRLTWYLFGAGAMILAILSYLVLRNRPAEKGLQPLGLDPAHAAAPGDKRSALAWGKVYRSPAVWHLGLVYSAFGFSYIIYMTFFIRYLTGELGMARQAAGNLFMLMGWFSLACGLIWGGLSDRIGRKRALILVFLVHAAAFSTFALWPSQTGLTLSAILFGLSAWSIPAIMAAACGDVLGPQLAPAALGFITLFFGIGQAISPSVAGVIADSSGSFAGAFLLAASVALVGAIAAGFLRPDHDGSPTHNADQAEVAPS